MMWKVNFSRVLTFETGLISWISIKHFSILCKMQMFVKADVHSDGTIDIDVVLLQMALISESVLGLLCINSDDYIIFILSRVKVLVSYSSLSNMHITEKQPF